MARFHESHISKVQRIIGYVLSVLFSLQILIAGVLKLIHEPGIVGRMSQITNWGDKLLFVGILELVILVVYWVPKTMKFGFYLFCSYMGGVIVAEVVADTEPTVGIVTTILLYAGTIMRNPSLLK